MNFLFSEQESVNKPYTVAFYNLENLFDTVLDTDTLDLDFTPNGIRQWTPKRYKKKLKRLARTINEIGLDSSGKPPVLEGIAEVEKGSVIQELLETPPLKAINYNYVHYESPDERGIDTALIYNEDYFQVLDSKPIPLIVHNDRGDRDTTRDILYVKGALNGETIHLFVNHWPSKRTGDEETDYKRIEAAHTINSFMEVIEETN